MKVGSLVECINNVFPIKPTLKYITIPKTKVVYTVREIREAQSDIGPTVLLEEIINKINPDFNIEQGYRIVRFRELLPPISNIEETINQNSLEYEKRI